MRAFPPAQRDVFAAIWRLLGGFELRVRLELFGLLDVGVDGVIPLHQQDDTPAPGPDFPSRATT
jgi:hypothetical protein